MAHQARLKRFKCGYCGKAFARNWTRNQHQINEHQGEEELLRELEGNEEEVEEASPPPRVVLEQEGTPKEKEDTLGMEELEERLDEELMSSANQQDSDDEEDYLLDV